ncbi:hypothetical protein V0R50_10650 [Pseudomonas sp. 148P]|uniref:Uncharacterized protein n=1 Tax=Pseudomonas ulcerans TaxID=3115852 RepID=A0ABU7HQ79_9PSED|nr:MULTISPECIES: hypothetical protein [unclassified Pseudomonas]MEE1922703.1 hypothetical protein [Pseudomonas sp. 147P]MEE1933680.1 hypothetical protein [Pseudomonas sp. 148P]
MGQARQRKLLAQKFESLDREWLLSLSVEDRFIVDTATRIHRAVVMEGGMWGGCYHLSFFLKRYLKKERNIDVDVVIGWVGEDSWNGVASHGWVESRGRRIDMALSRTENPDVLPTGSFIVLDRVLLKGMVDYRYYPEIPEHAKETLVRMALQPETSVESKQAHARHRQMLSMVEDDQAIDAYLDTVSSGVNYRALALLAGLPST